ncbi:MAG TPA: 3-hydroxyacyl-CoA dehydrogenase [Burkholderiales bacterium]|nr:3-hydroxyacyl-CoA dehydrogenase [Burkholderiales bacterium]
MARNTADRDLTVGVIGTGTMGRGIMQVAATGGMQVLACDERATAAADAKDYIAKMLARSVEKGRVTAEAAKAAVDRIGIAADFSGLAQCDIIIEAVAERLDVKQAVFSKLDAAARPDCILATNTSSLSVTAIAASCKRPQRVAGFHFFNPVPLMKLVEVIPGLKTDPAVTEMLMAVGRRMGREPVLALDSPGFLVNHVGRAYVPEALRIVGERIARPHDIDHIMREAAGFRMGPFELLDLVGADVAHPVMESLYEQYYGEPMYAPLTLMRQRVAGNLLGRKTAEGFYRYENGKAVVPPPAIVPDAAAHNVWISPHDSDGHQAAKALLSGLGATVESGDTPTADALCIVTPYGQDATTAVVAQRLSPERTVALDTLFSMEQRRTIMVTPLIDQRYRDAAHALLAGDGAQVTIINDSPGFIAQRIVAMLINVGCNIAQQRIATPADVDAATRLGLNYPFGPLEFGDHIGTRKVLKILEAMHDFYQEPRYRPAAWLRRRALLGVSLLTPDAVI